mgnify:CR=1 FL=1
MEIQRIEIICSNTTSRCKKCENKSNYHINVSLFIKDAHTMKITSEEQAEAENVSEETILSNKVNRLKEMGYKITKEGDYND